MCDLVYDIAKSLPRDEYELSVQLRKAAVSVPSNISEGYGRRSRPDYLRFLSFAAASNREIHTQLTIIVRVKLKRREEVALALELSVRVGQMLTKLIQSLER